MITVGKPEIPQMFPPEPNGSRNVPYQFDRGMHFMKIVVTLGLRVKIND